MHREIEISGGCLTSGIVCIDSLHMFRQLYYEKEQDVTETKMTGVASCLSLSIEETNEPEDGDVLPQKIINVKKLNETTPKKQMVEVFTSIPNPAKKFKLVSSKKNLKFE